jgi:hypothetical protein
MRELAAKGGHPPAQEKTYDEADTAGSIHWSVQTVLAALPANRTFHLGRASLGY